MEKVQDTMSRFGSVEIHPNGSELLLKTLDAALMELLRLRKPIAQVFQFSASVQAVRRLGLTATLIREDRRETDVFSLIGPKCFAIPWREIERQGWIAQTKCTEIRIPLLEQTNTT